MKGPLGVIVAFLSVAEAALATAAVTTTGGIQWLLTSFAVLFPSAVAAVFFVILWKKPYVLYPPESYDRPDVFDFVSAMRNAPATGLYDSIRVAVQGGTEEALGPQGVTPNRDEDSPPDGRESTLADDAAKRIMERVSKEAFIALEFDERLPVLVSSPTYLPYVATSTTAELLVATMRILNASFVYSYYSFANYGREWVAESQNGLRLGIDPPVSVPNGPLLMQVSLEEYGVTAGTFVRVFSIPPR